MLFVFFFKQKTAYEMRISDWSSDVCSSDLAPSGSARDLRRRRALDRRAPMAAYRQQENLGQHAFDLVGGQVSPVDAPVAQPRRQPVVAQPIARLGGRPRRDQLMAEMRIGMRRGVPIAELIIDRRRGRILDRSEEHT